MARSTASRPPAKKPAATPSPPPSPWPAAPALEWAASGLGLVLTLGAIGFILWEAFQPSASPAITLRALEYERSAGGWIVEVEARNASLTTAAAVEVEGILSAGGEEVETSSMVFDYVPGEGRRRGGLVFENDPRANELTLRTRGYVRP